MAKARIKINNLCDISRKEIEEIIDQYIRDEDDRYMFSRYYLDGIPFQEIGFELDEPLSRQAVSRRISKAYKIVIKHIHNINKT